MSDWRIHAIEFLSSRSVTKIILQGIWKKVFGKNCPSDLNKEAIIQGVMTKLSSPQELLTKQEITAAILRSYLQLDSKDTIYSVQELHNIVIQRWSESSTTSTSGTLKTELGMILLPYLPSLIFLF